MQPHLPQRLIVRTAASLLICTGGFEAGAAPAQTVIEAWDSIRSPPPPAIKPAAVPVAGTALLLLDFDGAQNPAKGPCNPVKIPRCIASIPRVRALLALARSKGVTIIYTLGGAGEVADIATALRPLPGDAVVKSGPDKFIGTELEAILRDKNIRTVIVAGTAAEGAILDTATHAALLSLNVVVPVDGLSSSQLYAEQYVTWQLTHAIGLADKVTLTRTDLISF